MAVRMAHRPTGWRTVSVSPTLPTLLMLPGGNSDDDVAGACSGESDVWHKTVICWLVLVAYLYIQCENYAFAALPLLVFTALEGEARALIPRGPTHRRAPRWTKIQNNRHSPLFRLSPKAYIYPYLEVHHVLSRLTNRRNAACFAFWAKSPRPTGGIDDVRCTVGALCSQKTSANHSAPHSIDHHNSEHAIHDRGFSSSSTGRRTNREGKRSADSCWPAICRAACSRLAEAAWCVPLTYAGSPNCPGSIRIWSVRTPPPTSWGGECGEGPRRR